MSASGMWFSAAVSGDRAAELAPTVAPAIRAAAARPGSVAAWSRWQRRSERSGGAVRVHGPAGRTTEEALHLYDMVNDSALDALPDFLGLCGDFEESVEPFVASARKDNPVAALFHGLGPRRAGALPGWAGDALLTHAELCERLPGISNALGPSGAERDQVLARIADWLDEADPERLMDGPLRVCRQAAEAGLALLWFRIWV